MRRLALVAIATIMAAAATSCEPRLPARPHDIDGLIANATFGEGGATIQVEVPESDKPPESSSSTPGPDKASVRVTGDTPLFDAVGEQTALTQLRVGSRVRVWFEGPVAESYPVQATAGAVQILE